LNVYNVAGIAPLLEWTAHYGGNGQTPDRPQGAPRWLDSRADVLFEQPPRSVSTKHGPTTRTVLVAFDGGAATQLAALPDDAARTRALQAHLRWDDTREPGSEEWMRAAVAAGNGALLAERLRRTPDDVALLRLRQDTAGAQREAVCAADTARAKAAPDNGDLAYLALRCRPEGPDTVAAFQAAAARWPTNPWLRFAVTYDLLSRGQFAAAAPQVPALIEALPAMRERLALLAARLQRLQKGAAADYAPYLPLSPRLRALLDAEQGGSAPQGPERAIAELAVGNLSAAKHLVVGAPIEPYVARLIGASDGASAEQVARVLDIPVMAGMEPATVLPSAALALRMDRDASAYLKAARTYFFEADAVERFLRAVKANRSQAECEQSLGPVSPELRPLAYAAALVLLKDKAPAEWRRVANGMLFAPERPHFY
jgi:hypothetical protein